MVDVSKGSGGFHLWRLCVRHVDVHAVRLGSGSGFRV